MPALTFKCPSCETRLAPVEAMQAATQVIRRTCRKCHETWQITVRPMVVKDGMRVDAGEFQFISRAVLNRSQT